MRWSAADLARVASNLREHIEHPINKAPRKYRNHPIVQDDTAFDSKLEAKRYRELQLLEKAGAISKLEFHRHWDLHVNHIKIGYYEADFTYLEGGQTVIEDAKGFRTALYKWKKRHVLAEYGIEIREINAQGYT
jgi:Protein of unknown function (DUF1064)